MDSKQDILRDPIWQFIGVVVVIVAIFIGFLTLPASVQGVALIGIAVTCIFLIFIFAGKVVGLSLLVVLFFFIATIWFFLISGLTYYQASFFVSNFGLYAP